MSADDDYDLDDAIARHYARQQEGLPPLPPERHQGWSLFLPHRRWLATYYPVPRPPGGWMHPIPPFDWWLEHRWPSLAPPPLVLDCEDPACEDPAPEA